MRDDDEYAAAFPRLAGRRHIIHGTVSTCPACGRFTQLVDEICLIGPILYSCITRDWSVEHITVMRRTCGGPVLRRVPK